MQVWSVWYVLHAARLKCRTQKSPKKSPSMIWAPSHNFVRLSSQLRHVYTIGWKRVKHNISPTCPYNNVNFGLLAAEIVSLIWGTSANFSRLGSVTARHSSTRRQRNFAALNRGRHLYLAGRPSRWTLAHILVDVLHLSHDVSLLLWCAFMLTWSRW